MRWTANRPPTSQPPSPMPSKSFTGSSGALIDASDGRRDGGRGPPASYAALLKDLRDGTAPCGVLSYRACHRDPAAINHLSRPHYLCRAEAPLSVRRLPVGRMSDVSEPWPIVDVSAWTFAGVETQGRQAHDWLSHESRERTWLFKPL